MQFYFHICFTENPWNTGFVYLVSWWHARYVFRLCVCVALYIDQQQQDMTGCQIAMPPTLILNSI